MSKFSWWMDHDQEDNSYWILRAPYTDVDLEFRLRQRLESDRIVWVADHDRELGGEGLTWPTLEEAKAECEAAYDACFLES